MAVRALHGVQHGGRLGVALHPVIAGQRHQRERRSLVLGDERRSPVGRVVDDAAASTVVPRQDLAQLRTNVTGCHVCRRQTVETARRIRAQLGKVFGRGTTGRCGRVVDYATTGDAAFVTRTANDVALVSLPEMTG